MMDLALGLLEGGRGDRGERGGRREGEEEKKRIARITKPAARARSKSSKIFKRRTERLYSKLLEVKFLDFIPSVFVEDGDFGVPNYVEIVVNVEGSSGLNFGEGFNKSEIISLVGKNVGTLTAGKEEDLGVRVLLK